MGAFVWFVSVRAIYWFIDKKCSRSCSERENVKKLSTGEFVDQYVKKWVKEKARRKDGDCAASVIRWFIEREALHRTVERGGSSDMRHHPDPDKYARCSDQELGPFISHAWGANLLEVLAALEGQLGLDGMFWMDSFSLNQTSDLQRKPGWWATIFFGAMQACSEVLMVFDPVFPPFLRLWCQFETFTSLQLGKNFAMILTSGGVKIFSDACRQKEDSDQLGTAETVRLAGGSNSASRVPSPTPRTVPLPPAPSSFPPISGEHQIGSAHLCRRQIAKDFFDMDISIENSNVSQQADKETILAKVGEQNKDTFNMHVSFRLKKELRRLFKQLDLETSGRDLGLDIDDSELKSHLPQLCHLPQLYFLETEVIDACASGASDSLRKLLARGVDFSAVDGSGKTALHVAAEHGHESVVAELLLSPDVDVNAVDNTCFGWVPLHYAAASGRDLVLERLITRNADPMVEAYLDYKTPLHLAAEHGHVKTVELLLSLAAKKSNSTMNPLQAETRDGASPLHLAAMCGCRSTAELLVVNNADVNAPTFEKFRYDEHKHIRPQNGRFGIFRPAATLKRQDTCVARSEERYDEGSDHEGWEWFRQQETQTPLHLSAMHGRRDTADLLIMLRAEVNAKNGFGRTALHLAASRGHTPTVELLVANRAEINSTVNGETALHFAARGGWVPTAELLISNGAWVNAAAFGWTPLNLAAREGHTDMAELLICHGAEVNGRFQEPPLHLAAKHGHRATAELLIRKGAQVNARTRPNHLAVTGSVCCVLH